MMDFLKQLLHDHFTAILTTAGVLVATVLVLSVVMFRELMTHYERTRKAMYRFVQFIAGLRGAAKGESNAGADLGKTISEPMAAVPPDSLR